jgi:diguanylate cyclase (GGDEF)-like protein
LAILTGIIIVLIALYFRKNKQYIQYKFLYDRTRDINDTLIKVSEELNNFRDIDVLYTHLLENTMNLIEGAQAGSILIYNSEKDYMEYKASIGYNHEELRKLTLKKEELFLYNGNQLKQPRIIRNPVVFDSVNLKKINFEKLMESNSLDIKSTISTPLHVNGEFYGVINVDNKSSEEAFSNNDIKLIKYISRHLEIAIKNVLLMNELKKALRMDKLTNIYNRRHFEELMENMIKDGERGLKNFCLVMIDLDDFKLINDNYGHKLGDEALQFFARILLESASEGDIVARYAGDEFILVVNNMSKEEVWSRISHIRRRISEFSKPEIKLAFSAGICEYEVGYDLDRLVTVADTDMYRDKRKRKNTDNCDCY